MAVSNLVSPDVAAAYLKISVPSQTVSKRWMPPMFCFCLFFLSLFFLQFFALFQSMLDHHCKKITVKLNQLIWTLHFHWENHFVTHPSDFQSQLIFPTLN